MAEEKKEIQEVPNNDNNQVKSPENPNDHKVNPEIDVKSEEIKMLEEKEHYELEYFSKDEILEKTKKIEKELKEFKDKVGKLQKENSDSKNKYMHLQAEFENAQKRWNKNRQNLRIEYTASVLKKFLPLYDSFKKAIDSANETEKKIIENFYNQFMSVYKSYNAEPIKIEINDIFDYNKHEALSSVEKDDVPENSIVEIIQDGWKYDKVIIRYSKVLISRKPKPPEPEEKQVEEPVKEEDTEDEKVPEITEPDRKKPKEKKHKKQKKVKKKESSG